MRLLALLHRWAGGIVGLLLAVIGLSGTVLVWEESWIGLPGADDPLTADPAAIGAAVATAVAEDPALSRITFADDRLGLHQAIYADGGGAYLTQGGVIVDRWDSMWGRPELWLFDLHHYLFMGETGKYATGALGLLLLAFSVTGLILWWRTRRSFEFRLWPARFTKGAIIRQHRDIGAVASPVLILAALTGTFMVFPALSDALLTPWAEPSEASATPPKGAGPVDSATDWPAIMINAQAAFPDALPRRLMLPREAGAPLALRMKQAFEWTPNGRTYVYLDPVTADVLGTQDPAKSDAASRIGEKYYPIHAGKVGGMAWRLVLTFSGLALVMLGTLATWSFWFGSKRTKARRRSPVPAIADPAE
ncbi:PepSY-associated TM helix domain-containing protein [Pelagerythrobacter rhizovicinus]|uniref:PepSY domain-containing protein n=1 Tax=Pelagerythrobacter rhizovicinus TaxID=2268576 RepID=A0A4Q2KS72_9SPHN|nr:PepSY-associated TM helix domain-containing protein [Pelagerythrobacter rhizovicinus]RXZ66552.1 PepSY domain-containing protein [Pelagerythrobacter rhizovicinus]